MNDIVNMYYYKEINKSLYVLSDNGNVDMYNKDWSLKSGKETHILNIDVIVRKITIILPKIKARNCFDILCYKEGLLNYPIEVDGVVKELGVERFSSDEYANTLCLILKAIGFYPCIKKSFSNKSFDKYGLYISVYRFCNNYSVYILLPFEYVVDNAVYENIDIDTQKFLLVKPIKIGTITKKYVSTETKQTKVYIKNGVLFIKVYREQIRRVVVYKGFEFINSIADKCMEFGKNLYNTPLYEFDFDTQIIYLTANEIRRYCKDNNVRMNRKLFSKLTYNGYKHGYKSFGFEEYILLVELYSYVIKINKKITLM